MKLTRHELADRYILKLNVLGLHDMVKLEFLPNDRVALLKVNDSDSTDTFVIPSFVTELGALPTLNVMPFADTNFSEIHVDNDPNLNFDASSLCACMESIRLKVKFTHPENIVKAHSMFKHCKAQEIDLSELTLPHCVDIGEMFSGCCNLNQLDLSHINASMVRNISYLVDGCCRLTEIDLSGITSHQITSIERAFCNCENLTNLDLSKLDLSHITDITSLCEYCCRLSKIAFANEGLPSLKKHSSAFEYCFFLKSIEPPSIKKLLRKGQYGYFLQGT